MKLECLPNGDVMMKVLCRDPIFVQSEYLDFLYGLKPGDAIHQIAPNSYLKVFQMEHCCHQMKQLAINANQNVRTVVHSVREAVAQYGTDHVKDNVKSKFLRF